jgi:hydrogenase nickel incorporation protein HypA/HybF
MHEIALAQSIVEIVEEHARRDSFARIRSIRLAIGALSGVDPRALQFGFEAAAKGTVAEGAILVIDRPPGQAWCTDCDGFVPIAGLGDPCPACGGRCWTAARGDELRVTELEVE